MSKTAPLPHYLTMEADREVLERLAAIEAQMKQLGALLEGVALFLARKFDPEGELKVRGAQLDTLREVPPK